MPEATQAYDGVMLVRSGGQAAVPEWQAAFARYAPGLAVRWWDDPDVDPTSVAYVVVWEPEPGRLARYPNLRIVFSSAAGVDHIVRDPDWPSHLPLVRMITTETTQSIGEYVCFAALAMLRRLPRIQAAQRDCRWDNFEGPDTAPETRVGIMGFGTLGQASARMLSAIGFPVAGWSRTPKPDAGYPCFAGMAELEPFLRQTDIAVGLLPDTPDTRGLLDAARFAMLPQGASVVNAGRGGLVVLDDLIASLDAGHLRSAMLDVFDPEPLPSDHPAWRHPSIVVTCHVAGFASRRARAEAVAQALHAWRRGEGLPNLYVPERGYWTGPRMNPPAFRATLAGSRGEAGMVEAGLRIASMRERVSAEEWRGRVDLAACYRLVALYQMADMGANHVSLRVPGEPNAFLINPYGMMYEEITASSLVKIDENDGNILAKPDYGEGFDYGINRAGFVIHSAVHKARARRGLRDPHAHLAGHGGLTRWEDGLLPMTQTAMRFARIGYHDYNGVVLDLERAGAAGARSRPEQRADPAQPRLAHHRLERWARRSTRCTGWSCRARRSSPRCPAARSRSRRSRQHVIEATYKNYQPGTRRPYGVLEWPALAAPARPHRSVLPRLSTHDGEQRQDRRVRRLSDATPDSMRQPPNGFANSPVATPIVIRSSHGSPSGTHRRLCPDRFADCRVPRGARRRPD